MAKGRLTYTAAGDVAEYSIDGIIVTKEEFDATFPSKPLGAPNTTPPSCYPMKSIALAMDPSQVDEGNERNRRHGINVQYERGTGLAEIPDGGEYRKLRRLESKVLGREIRNRDSFVE